MEKKKSKIAGLKAKANSDGKRRELIAAFYEIIRDGREVSRYNKDLQKDIYITSRSVSETKTHASKSKTSTLAVLDLLEIMENAIRENTTNQQRFKKMIILEYKLKDIGKVKLTVGVTKTEDKHIQYCITAVE